MVLIMVLIEVFVNA